MGRPGRVEHAESMRRSHAMVRLGWGATTIDTNPSDPMIIGEVVMDARDLVATIWPIVWP
jgi:hypothetical protein